VAIHFQTEVGNGGYLSTQESIQAALFDQIGQAARRFRVPFGKHPFEIQRRVFALQFIGEREIQF
jgi:hypothetical protein